MGRVAMTAGAAWAWLLANRHALRRLGLALSAVAFAAGLYWSLQGFPAALTPTIWPLVLLLAFCFPLAVVLNAAEFHVMARVAGLRVGWSTALETTVLASAANMLPLPGGAIARIAALKAGGATFGLGSIITGLFAGIWGGMAFCLSGGFLVILSHQALGWLFAAGGLALLGGCTLMALRLNASAMLLAQAFAVRIVSLLLVEVLGQMLAIWSLGAAIGFGEASVFAVSSFVGSAVSLVPAGLGVREFVVAALSPLVALPPMVGFLSVAVNRAVAMIGLAVLSVGLLIGGHSRLLGKDRAASR